MNRKLSPIIASVALFMIVAPGAGLAQPSSGTIMGVNVDWSPDGQTLAFTANWDGDWEIYTMDLNGEAITQLTHNEQMDFAPAFSANGRSLIYASRVDGSFQIHRVDTNGGAPTTIIAEPGTSLMYAEETTDAGIIFSANLADGGGAEIRRFDIAGGKVTTLISDGSTNTTPTWSPDGSGFFFASNRSGQQQIYAADADGSNQRVLTSLPGGPDRYFGSAKPSLTPDGKMLVYWGDQGGSFIHDHHHNVLNMDTGEVVVLPKRILSMAYPDVSPSGDRIAYVASLGGDRPFSVYVMDLDGANHRTIWSAR